MDAITTPMMFAGYPLILPLCAVVVLFGIIVLVGVPLPTAVVVELFRGVIVPVEFPPACVVVLGAVRGVVVDGVDVEA